MSNNNMLQALTREGVLIAVSVRFWRAAKKLQASDLGLDPDDITNGFADPHPGPLTAGEGERTNS